MKFHQNKISQLMPEKVIKKLKKQIIKARENSRVFYEHLQKVSKQGLKFISIDGNKKKEKNL